MPSPDEITKRTEKLQGLFGPLAKDFLKIVRNNPAKMEEVVNALQAAYADFGRAGVQITGSGTCPTGWDTCTDGSCMPPGGCSDQNS